MVALDIYTRIVYCQVMKKWLLFAPLAVILLISVSIGVFTRESPQTAPETVVEAVEVKEEPKEPEDTLDPDEIFLLVNQYRTNNGKAALVRDARLDASAMAKCLDMQEKNYIAHVSPDGIEPWYFFKQAGVPYDAAGENIAFIATVDEVEIVDAWIKSDSHRKNMIEDFTHAGIAVCADDTNWTRPGDMKYTINHFASY